MYVVEIFLPLTDNKGYRFGESHLCGVRRILVEKFGGATIYARSPALGISQENGHTAQDDIVVFEVMSETLDREWWTSYRKELEHEFRQNEVLIRVQSVEKL